MATERSRVALGFWKVVNPLTRGLAGYLPWWVLMETTGRRTGKRRRIPFANGPFDGKTALLLAVHGARSSFAHNIAADPNVRLKRRGRWLHGTASLGPLDAETIKRFGFYARTGLRTFGQEPMLLRIDLTPR